MKTRFLSLSGWFLLATAPLFAQNFADWQFRTELKDTLRTGDTITFTVGWKGKSGYSWTVRADSAFLSVMDPLPAETLTVSDGKQVAYSLKMPYQFWGFSKDTLNPVFFILKNQTGSDSVWFATPAFFPDPKLATDEGDTLVRPEKDIIETTRPWWHYLLWVLATAAGIAIIWYVIYRIRKNRKLPQDEVETVTAPVKTPYDLFVEQMNRLLEGKETWHEQVKGFYSDLIEILKKYLEGISGSPVAEMTSDEFLSWLETRSDLREILPDMNLLLQRADLIKFAKQQAVYSQMASDFNSVRKAGEAIDLRSFPGKQAPQAEPPAASLTEGDPS